MDSRRNFIGTVAGGIAGTLAAPAEVLGANDRVRFGLIGAGARGMQLLREALGCRNAECVAVADVYQTRREQAGGVAPSAKIYSSPVALLEDARVDAVLIATPQHLHAAQFVAAMEAGKHIYLERAAALTAAGARRMKAARVGRHGQVVQIGHQYCSAGTYRDAARFLGAGWLGHLTALDAHHHRNTPRGKPQWRRPVYPDMTPESIDWTAFLGDAPAREFAAERFLNWRLYRDYSGGSVHENMSQQLAFWYRLLELSVPTRVTAAGALRLWDDGREIPDVLTVVMEHGEEFTVTWRVNCGNSHLGTGEYLLGTGGTIYRGQQVRYWPQKVNRPEGLETQGRTRTEHRAHMNNFFDSVREQARPNCSFEIGYRVAVACAMAIESCRRQAPVRWDAEREAIA